MKGEVDSVQIATTDVILASQLSMMINKRILSEWNAVGLALTCLTQAKLFWKPCVQLRILPLQFNQIIFILSWKNTELIILRNKLQETVD